MCQALGQGLSYRRPCISGIVIVVLELPMRKLSCGGLESDWDLSEATQPEEATTRSLDAGFAL